MTEPGARARSTVGANRLMPLPGASRQILVVGARRVYLQALCEVVGSTPGLSASLVAPEQTHDRSDEAPPNMILLECSANPEGSTRLASSLRGSFPDVPLLLLTSGPSRENGDQTATLDAAGWLSTNLPVAELITALRGRATAGRGNPGRRSRPPAPGAGTSLSDLSEREILVLRLVVGGQANEEIAESLGISRHTVRTHLQNIMAKMLVRSRMEMVSVALRSGMRASPVAHRG